MKIDATVKKETKYIALWGIILSLVLEAVFLIISRWDYTVLLGNVLGTFASTLNFFLLGLTVQKAVLKDEKEAKTTMKLSQTYRNIMMLIIAALGVSLDCFNVWATLIPFFFPRVAIAFRTFTDKKGDNQ
jgi:putative Mn2+ efflux pump MntP